MPDSNPAVKTYTQPACTLQIVDHSLPSSPWEGRSTDGQIEFKLHFDDPQLAQEKQISIGGDRHQLAELHEAVTNYLQNFLGSSHERFDALLSAQTNRVSDSTVPFPQTLDSVSLDKPDVTTNDTTAKRAEEIYLQPDSKLSHKLFLGSLANHESGQVIQLSTLQLFDLATILDEYAADVLTTPAFNRPPRTTSSTPSTAWASIAAMLLLAVGLTAAIVQLLNRSDEQPQIANRAVTPRANTNNEQIALQPSATPKLSSPDTLPSLPPSVNTTTPSTAASPPVGIPPGAAPLPGTPLPLPQTTPATPSPPAVSTTKTLPIIPPTGSTQIPSIPIKPVPKPNLESISLPKTATPEASSVTTLPGIPSTADLPTPPRQSNPAGIAPSSVEPSQANRGATPEITTSPSKLTTQQRLQAALEDRSGENPSGLPPRASDSPTISEPKTTALATNTPQLAEVRNYFQQRWEVPPGLTQTLEYSIVLDVDGSIQRIEPLGKAARTYVDRSGMPLIGEPFVSANSNGETPRVRVVLGPDGKVETFMEPN